MDPACKIIHQTWKTSEIPEHWRDSPRKWQVLHPDWGYKLWTDADNLDLIRTAFPQYLDMYRGYEYDIQRADFVRYAILKTYGGLYSDLDIVPLRRFDDETFKGTRSEVYLMKNNSYLKPSVSFGAVTNALMIGGTRGCPFWQAVMDEAARRYRKPHWTWMGKHRKVMEMTGPNLVQHVAHRYPYPLTFLSTDVTLCSVCDPPGTTRGTNPQILSIEGRSWNGLDTRLLNFCFCNAAQLLAVAVLVVAYFVCRFYAYKSYCAENECVV